MFPDRLPNELEIEHCRRMQRSILSRGILGPLDRLGLSDWLMEEVLIMGMLENDIDEGLRIARLRLPKEPAVHDPAADAMNGLAEICHQANLKWWLDLSKPCGTCRGTSGVVAACLDCSGLGYARKERNVGELLMLIVSELAEAMEGDRKGLMDDKLPHRKMLEVEIADAFIRLFDFCGGKGLDIGGAFVEKMAYNQTRADHQIENRKAEGGKKY